MGHSIEFIPNSRVGKLNQMGYRPAIKNMEEKNNLAFGRKNYQIMLVGIAVLVLGYVFMSIDTETMGFGTMGLTVGPLTVLLGFGIEFYAILHKPKED